jgi:hypothetical protein
LLLLSAEYFFVLSVVYQQPSGFAPIESADDIHLFHNIDKARSPRVSDTQTTLQHGNGRLAAVQYYFYRVRKQIILLLAVSLTSGS